MPIRFRCAYCNQLLGIARRKSGQVVRCPTCAGQVVVPQAEADDPEPPPSPPPTSGDQAQPPFPAPAPPLFERSDFDNLLNEPVLEIIDDDGYQHAAAPTPERPRQVAAPPPPQASLKFDVERVNAPAPQPQSQPGAGIVISPLTATILTVTWIISLGVMFGLGWFIGGLR